MRFVIVALLAVTITGCSAPAAVGPTTTPSPQPSPTPSQAATATAVASPSPFATPTPITDLAQVFRPLTTGWRPTGPTLMFGTREADGVTLVAVPFGPNGRTGEPIRLLSFIGGEWDLRSDGGALAVAVSTALGIRIAVWDIASSTGRWITASGPDAVAYSPVWSKDGNSIFFGTPEGPDTGAVKRVGVDGQGLATIGRPDRFGGLVGIAPDGGSLIWSRGQEGGSAELLEIATGANKHLGDNARVVSWRTQQPRVLLMVGGCCAGRPGGSLEAFDDDAMTSTVVAEVPPDGRFAFGAGAWDPSGMRIVAWRYDGLTAGDASLVIIDPRAGTIQPISDVLGIGAILWLDLGIVVTRALARSAESDVVLVPPQGGPSIQLYRGSGIGRLVVVRP